MTKSIKIRIYPNKTQINIINGTLGCCRYIKNHYIAYNKKRYEVDGGFTSGYDFSIIINELKRTNEKYYWICNYSSKAIKKAIMEEEKAFKDFFKKNKGFPKFKSRKFITKESYFFIKNNIRYTDNKYIIKLPILGKIRITEYEYLPELSSISSGRIIKENGLYYVMFVYETPSCKLETSDYKLSIDVGIEYYATIKCQDPDFTKDEKGDVRSDGLIVMV